MEGSCLCTAIKVTAADHAEIGLCHCGICRRWSGGPMFAVHCGPDVRFEGAAPVVYSSSEWASRGFCGTCGTHLFYQLQTTGEYILSAGLFPGRDFVLASQIFIDEKPAFYALANKTPELTGQQVFEQFAASHAD